MNISKELLSEVLDLKVFASISNDTNELKCLFVDLDKSKELRINIYELAHKCKEWAYENDYYVYSIFTFAGEGFCYLTHENNISKRLITFEANTEPEAIFKACQWILENLKD